jgi:hypoxanthine phosphoribosyltransferase
MDLVQALGIGIASSVIAAVLIASRRKLRRNFTFRAVHRTIGRLHQQIVRDGYDPEYVVAIDRNSGVVGSILVGSLGLSSIVSVSTINRREPDGSRTITIDPVHEAALRKLGKRRVLVLICCNDSGTSLNYVTAHLAALRVPPATVRTAALYSSQSPAVQARYVGAVAGKDFKYTMPQVLERLPWVDSKWRLQLAAERTSR